MGRLMMALTGAPRLGHTFPADTGLEVAINAVRRRTFLGLLAGAAFAPDALVSAAPPGVPRAHQRLLQVNGYAINAETPLDALTTYLTPNDLFFLRSHMEPTDPDPKTWTLTVDGEVSSPVKTW